MRSRTHSSPLSTPRGLGASRRVRYALIGLAVCAVILWLAPWAWDDACAYPDEPDSLPLYDKHRALGQRRRRCGDSDMRQTGLPPREEAFIKLTQGPVLRFYDSLRGNLNMSFDAACGLPPSRVPLERPELVALASWPQSGTTWTKFLFERATGVASEAIYPERGLPTSYGTYRVAEGQTGLARPLRDGEPAFVKTHNTEFQTEGNYYSRVVRLIRHPLENIRSNWLRQVAEGTHNASDTVRWHRYAQEEMAGYVDWHCTWSDYARRGLPVLNVHYEDLLRAPREQMRNVLSFVGYPVDESALAEAIQTFRPRFAWSGMPRYWEELTPPETLTAMVDVLTRALDACEARMSRPLPATVAEALSFES